MNLSRRAFTFGLATAAVASTLEAGQAQADVWREYRRDDVGFRIEMPGEPKVETEENEFNEFWTRSVNAEVEHEQVHLRVTWTEYKAVISAEDMFRLFRDGMRLGGFSITREVTLVMNGYPAREFIADTDQHNFIRREAVLDNVTIAAEAYGDRGIHTSPTVRRFLDTFALLRSR